MAAKKVGQIPQGKKGDPFKGKVVQTGHVPASKKGVVKKGCK